MLLSILRDEKLCTKKQHTNRMISEPAVQPIDHDKRADGLRPQLNKYETFKVDFDSFHLLLTELTDWGRCRRVNLAEKLFRVSLILFNFFFLFSRYNFIFSSLVTGQTIFGVFGL